MNYQDFDLLIDRSGDRLVAQVLNAPADQALAEFRMPFAEEEVENYLASLARNARGETPEVAAAKAFGASLFDAVFSREIRASFHRSLEEIRRHNSGLRLRLRFGDPALARLPWELLYDRSLGRFIALSRHTPLVRYMDLTERIQPLPLKSPLRVLAAISSPADVPAFDAEVEWTRLNEALRDLTLAGRLAIERLEEATIESLQRRLQSGTHHAFHFIGHGEFDPQSRDGVLIFEAEGRRSHRVRAQQLVTILREHAALRLVVLKASEAAGTTRPFADSAPSLVRQGMAAVVATQFAMADAAASLFLHEFYTRLAKGSAIDSSVTGARKSIFAAGHDVEWSTLALYSRVPDGRVFDIETSSTALGWARVEAGTLPVSSNQDTKGRIALDIVAAARGEFARGRRAHAIQMLRRYDLGRPAVAAALHELTLEHERLLAEERLAAGGAVREHLQAAEALLASGQPSEAWARACDALQLDPADQDAVALEARIRMMLEGRERKPLADAGSAAPAPAILETPSDVIVGVPPNHAPVPQAPDRPAAAHEGTPDPAPPVRAESVTVESSSRGWLLGVVAALAAVIALLAARAC